MSTNPGSAWSLVEAELTFGARKDAAMAARLNAVGELIEANGCDCECECDSESHDESCERCLACRISAVLQPGGA